MKVYTKKGDAGETSLYGGKRVSKASLKVMAYGAVDSANAALAVARVHMPNQMLKDLLLICQEKLFVVGGELASDPVGLQKLKTVMVPKDAQLLEAVIDEMEKSLPQHDKFIMPGTSLASAQLNLARTAVRTAERQIIVLSEEEAVNPQLMRFINRLSDMLFVMSRYVDALGGDTQKKTDTLALAEAMVEACQAQAKALGVPMVISVMDSGGHLVLLKRMENALVGSIDIAMNKAYTAFAFKLPTEALGNAALPGNSLYGIEQTNQGRVVIFGGGIPLMKNGEVLGAVGVSGGSVEEDIAVAMAAVKVFEMER